MALVFEIRNPDGSSHLDLSKRCTRFLGSYLIQSYQPSGTITHPAFVSQGKPFFFPVGQWAGNFPGAMPWIIAHNDRITWEYRGANNGPLDVTILYGVY